MKTLCFFSAAFFLCGCGSSLREGGSDRSIQSISEPEEGQSPMFAPQPYLGEASKERSLPLVKASFQSKQADQRVCLDQLVVTFPEPVRMQTLASAVRVSTADGSSGGFERALVLVSSNEALTQFAFETAKPEVCSSGQSMRSVVLASGIIYKNGTVEKSAHYYQLGIPKQNSINQWLPLSFIRTAAGVNQLPPPERVETGGPFQLRLEAAEIAMMQWQNEESKKQEYSAQGLLYIPFTGTILQAESSYNRERQFALPELVYILRQSATFLTQLFPDVHAVALGDASLPDGSTPFVWSGSEKIFLHPQGSHQNGQDIDIAYINTSGTVDVEKSFWLLYGILRHTGVDLVMTAYAHEFKAYALEMFEKGLVSATVLARFDSPKLQFDDGLNHDKHMHVSLRNADNQYKSILFQKQDDVYNCYIKLKPGNRGTGGNFCSLPF